jgi:acyl dehydratase
MPIHTKLREELKAAFVKAGYTRSLDGGMAYDFFRPVRAGDVLTTSQKVLDIYEREGKAEKLFFSIVETTYTNQNGEVVAKERKTNIIR